MAVYTYYVSAVLSCCCLFLLCCSTGTVLGVQQHRRHHHDEEDTPPPPPHNTCPGCRAGGHAAAADILRLEAIKRQILSKLGLRQKPNVTHSLPREVVMETLFRAEDTTDFFTHFDDDHQDTTSAKASSSSSSSSTSSSSQEPSYNSMDYDDFYGRTSEIISFAEEGSWVNKNRLLEFRVSAESGLIGGQEFRVRSATLWLKADVRPHRPPAACRTQIFVFKIISPRLPESVTVVSQQFQRMTQDPIIAPLEESNSGWQKIDLTDLVRTWLSTPAQQNSGSSKLQLFVDCSCCTNWQVHLLNNELWNEELDGSSAGNRPFLVIHTDPNSAKRVRRRAVDCTSDTGNQCCKQRFYVNFKDLGWDDWVIAPQGYYANYCRGDCGHHRTPDTYVSYHTHVIEEVRKTQHLAGMQPCCAPLKFSSMSLIYFGPESNIIKRDLPKMVVDECGCP